MNGHVLRGSPELVPGSWTCPPAQPTPVAHVHRSARAANMMPKCPPAATKVGHVLPGSPHPRGSIARLQEWTCPPGQPAPVTHVHRSGRAASMMPKCPLVAAKKGHVLPGSPELVPGSWTCPPGQPTPVAHVHRSARAGNMMPKCPSAAAKNGHVLPGSPQPLGMSIGVAHTRWACPPAWPAHAGHVHRSARAEVMMPKCPPAAAKNGHVLLGSPRTRGMSIAQRGHRT